MTIDVNRWSKAYLDELDRACAALPADRRAELRAQISAHLDAELAATTSDEEARAVLDRLGDPSEIAAEAAFDLPANAAPRRASPSGGEIAALLLMGIGGVALPLLAPAVGVLLMRSTPRWSAGDVRGAWLILGVGLLALLGCIPLAMIPNPSYLAGISALALIAVAVAVGPLAALYAATRPRSA